MGQALGVIFFIVAITVGIFVAGRDFSRLVLFPQKDTSSSPVAKTPAPPRTREPRRAGSERISARTPSSSAPQTPREPSRASSTLSPQTLLSLGVDSLSVPRGLDVAALLVSPYYRRVVMGSLHSREISLYGNFSHTTGTINVTGWTVRANNGSLIVPQAINIYDPFGFSEERDIQLRPGDRVRMFSSAGAVMKNFRINRCLGYLHDFVPALPRSCPKPYPSPEEFYSFSGVCQDYIHSLSYCALPPADPPVPKTDYACRDYLKTINFRSCYDRHRGDADFLGNEVWTWVGNIGFLDERHDRVLLLDRDGMVVDWRRY